MEVLITRLVLALEACNVNQQQLAQLNNSKYVKDFSVPCFNHLRYIYFCW